VPRLFDFLTSKQSGSLFRAALLGLSREHVFLDLKVEKQRARFERFWMKLGQK